MPGSEIILNAYCWSWRNRQNSAYVTCYCMITICDCIHDKGCLSNHEFLKFFERKRIKRLFFLEKMIYPQLETPFSSFFSTTMYIYTIIYACKKRTSMHTCAVISIARIASITCTQVGSHCSVTNCVWMTGVV